MGRLEEEAAAPGGRLALETALGQPSLFLAIGRPLQLGNPVHLDRVHGIEERRPDMLHQFLLSQLRECPLHLKHQGL